MGQTSFPDHCAWLDFDGDELRHAELFQAHIGEGAYVLDPVRARAAELTRADVRVLMLGSFGLAAHQTADTLHMSVNTVNDHVTHISHSLLARRFGAAVHESFVRGILRVTQEDASVPNLKHREREVLECLGLGLTQEEATRKVGYSLETVKTDVGRIRQAYGRAGSVSRLVSIGHLCTDLGEVQRPSLASSLKILNAALEDRPENTPVSVPTDTLLYLSSQRPPLPRSIPLLRAR
jgi:DNA-binding CsgD family transcriptional regulator